MAELYAAAAKDPSFIPAARWLPTTQLLADTPVEERTVFLALRAISACVVLSRPRPVRTPLCWRFVPRLY